MSKKQFSRRPVFLFLIVFAVIAFFPVFFKVRSSLFPSYYRHEIFTQADKNQVDPLLIAAIIFRESHFRPHQISPQGDRGLMQIQPSTIVELERVKLIPKGTYTIADLLVPESNIAIGTLYVRYLKDKITKSSSRMRKMQQWYNGEVWSVVLASYNAGPTLVIGQLLDNSSSKIEFERALRLKRLSTVHYVEDILRYYRSLAWMNLVYEFEKE
ncbi:MAG: lytic transglycosylase domain-containing protein [Parachlamydiales bacterium]|nr:lytic transglycosylase domain-containing protein [Parachlamydiales bacterium]